MAKVEKLIKKFRIVFDDQNYYEAHQVARTIFYRWLESAEYEKLSGFLYECILSFVNVNETTIAFDLADLYTKTIAKAAFCVDKIRLEQIEKIANVLAQTKSVNKNDSKKLSNPLSSFTGALINWSIETADISLVERQFGDARLNLIFAKAFEKSNQLEMAKRHYVCAKDPQSYARFIFKYSDNLSAEGHDNYPMFDEDHFVTLVVLQVLCIGRLGVATKLLHLLTEKYNKFSSRPPYTSAFLNFTWLLTLCIQLRSVCLIQSTAKLAKKLTKKVSFFCQIFGYFTMEYFTELVENYKPTLTRDSRLLMYVDKVGQKYFGVPPKDDNYSGGLLGNLLKGMITKKEVKAENPVEFKPDDIEFLSEYKITDQGFHSAYEAAEFRNPPGSCAEPSFSDALDNPATSSDQSKAQADMDLD